LFPPLAIHLFFQLVPRAAAGLAGLAAQMTLQICAVNMVDRPAAAGALLVVAL
jgi:hypothetical protein